MRILLDTVVSRQAELVELLRAKGLEATQSSASRNRRELGIVKGADHHRPPAVGDTLTPRHFEEVTASVKGWKAAGPDLSVPRTTTKAAQTVQHRPRLCSLPQCWTSASRPRTDTAGTSSPTARIQGPYDEDWKRL